MNATIDLLSALAEDGWNFRQDNTLTDSLISFGKLCRLFGWTYRLEIIEEDLKDFSKRESSGLWEISLQEASENAIFLHQLI
ncbi:MAG: hypothetical protein K2O18_07560, partial [Oscillospiraceae bacterium]|nr:hypothetical protein [Oscillospiraceae bacterium]